MKRGSVLILFLLFNTSLLAQSQHYSCYFGFKGFMCADLAQIFPKDEWFHGNKAWFFPSAGGLFTSYTIPSGWRAECGIQRGRESIVFKLGTGKNEIGNARLFGLNYLRYFTFPVSIGKQFVFFQGHLVLVSQVGLSVMLKKNVGTFGGFGLTTNLVGYTNLVDFSFDMRGSNDHNLTFFPFGKFGAEVYFRNGIRISTEFGYQIGTTKLTTGEIRYRVNNGQEIVRHLVTTGNMLWTSFGLQYPISRIWEKKKDIFWKKKATQEFTQIGSRILGL